MTAAKKATLVESITNKTKPFLPAVIWHEVTWYSESKIVVDWNNTLYQILADKILGEKNDRT